METKTEVETITVTKYTLTLTDADVAAILVDPAPFQKQLRQLRAENGQRLQKRRSISLNGHKPKEKAPAATGKGLKPLKLTVGCPEPGCGKRFKSDSALAIHRGRTHKASSAVTAAASPASD